MSDSRTTHARRQREAAFFDVDGTLVRTTIAHYLAYFQRLRRSRLLGRLWYAGFLAQCGYFLILDKINRSMMNRRFYRGYKGLPAEEIKAQSVQCHKDVIRPRLFDQAEPCIEQHKRAGRQIVLVTGSIDFIMAPLANEIGADAVLASCLLERDGRFTGALDGPPIGEQEKAVRIREYASNNDIDLARSHGYGDSIADLPMLEALGHAAVVNPDKALAAVARRRGWPVHCWSVGERQG